MEVDGQSPDAGAAVLFAICIAAMFGPEQDGPGSTAALSSLCARAGVDLVVPERLNALCCGTPWSSKGLRAGLDRMHDLTCDALAAASGDRSLPVVCDASSCIEGLRTLLAEDGFVIVDAIQFVHDTVLPRLTVHRRWPSLALHPTCSSTRLGLNEALLGAALLIADDVLVPSTGAVAASRVTEGCCIPS